MRTVLDVVEFLVEALSRVIPCVDIVNAAALLALEVENWRMS
jgi:hypothetical protein